MNNLLLEIENGVALLTISRPKSLNALNSETLSELEGLPDFPEGQRECQGHHSDRLRREVLRGWRRYLRDGERLR